MTRSAIALGSNLGDRESTLRGALDRLTDLGSVVSISGLYETAAIGGPEQDDYLNAVVLFESDLPASSLLAGMHSIERDFDRVRDVRWGPRTLDLDLILHGAEVHARDDLTVPHPRYRQRRFVLEPLIEVWPDGEDPDGTAFAAGLAAVAGQEIRRISGPEWARPNGSEGSGRGWVVAQALVLAAILGAAFLGEDQFSLPLLQLFGAGLVVLGILLLLTAFTAMGLQVSAVPRPMENVDLRTDGVYGYVRHPMYGAVMLASLGFSVLMGSALAVGVWPVLVVFFVAKTRHEERLLAARYPTYSSYVARVPKRFVPWLL